MLMGLPRGRGKQEAEPAGGVGSGGVEQASVTVRVGFDLKS